MTPHTTKRDYLFKFVPPEKRERLRLDDEAAYSVTDQYTADKITRDLLRFLSPAATVCDATACIGGNTFSFARAFRRVVAIERDVVRFEYLRHNMDVLGVHNVAFHQGDALEELEWAHRGSAFHCIFVDPPWGGPGYKRADRVQLALSGVPLADACIRMAACASYIALKVPTNFDVTAFVAATDGALELVWHNTQLRKIHLLIFRVVARGGQFIMGNR
jgi:16S rRNA G966 N2-methylase RsmD